MAVPYRRWLQFDMATLLGQFPPSKSGYKQSDWSAKYRNTCRLGRRCPTNINLSAWFYSIFRPIAGTEFESLLGMDQIVDVRWDTNLVTIANTLPITSTDLTQGFVGNSNRWSPPIVSGRYYDGSNAWDSYPPPQIPGYNPLTIEPGAATFSEKLTTYMYSWKAGGGNGVEANRYQDDFFRNGAYFKLDAMAGLPQGDRATFSLIPMFMDVRYFNPVVNQCLVDDVEKYWVPTTGGIEFKLVGLGFNNSNTELDGEGDSRGGGWDDLVDKIEFWKQQYAAMDFWRDDFNDATIGSIWTTHLFDADKYLTEAGGTLTATIKPNIDARWITFVNQAPKLYRTVPSKNTFEVVVKLNNFTLNNKTEAGIYIGYHDATKNFREACRFTLRRYDGVGEGMQVLCHNNDDSDWDVNCDSGDLPIWMKIKVAAGVISFWWSKDGSAWTQMRRLAAPYSLSGVFEQGMEIGIFAVVGDLAHGGIDAPFEYIAIDQGGAPYATLVRADGDFTVESNVQIKIPSGKFPNLEEGTYILRVIKEGMDFSPRNADVDVWGWAGDFRCALDGLVREGVRIAIDARTAPPPTEPREKGDSIILM